MQFLAQEIACSIFAIAEDYYHRLDQNRGMAWYDIAPSSWSLSSRVRVIVLVIMALSASSWSIASRVAVLVFIGVVANGAAGITPSWNN